MNTDFLKGKKILIAEDDFVNQKLIMKTYPQVRTIVKYYEVSFKDIGFMFKGELQDSFNFIIILICLKWMDLKLLK